MTDFSWLTADRLVQRTVFDGRIELVANFRADDFVKGELSIPARTVAATWLSSGEKRSYSPID